MERYMRITAVRPSPNSRLTDLENGQMLVLVRGPDDEPRYVTIPQWTPEQEFEWEMLWFEEFMSGR